MPTVGSGSSRFEEPAGVRKEEPAIAYRIMAGLGRELAKRMRIANRLNTELRT